MQSPDMGISECHVCLLLYNVFCRRKLFSSSPKKKTHRMIVFVSLSLAKPVFYVQGKTRVKDGKQQVRKRVSERHLNWRVCVTCWDWCGERECHVSLKYIHFLLSSSLKQSTSLGSLLTTTNQPAQALAGSSLRSKTASAYS